MKDQVEMYTDGACKGNPGPGGWGVLLRYLGVERELSGAERQTTNNRMELVAAIRGLQALNRPCSVRLVTDSTYLRQGITRWLPDWKRRNWRTAGRKAVKNVDLWQELECVVAGHEIQWEWVRGHSGHTENERADALANAAIAALLRNSGDP